MGILNRLYRIARSQLGQSGEGRTPHPTPPGASAPSIEMDPPSKEATYYANLELTPDASFSEIKSAYRRLLRIYHPDKHAQDSAKAEVASSITKQLNDAMAYFEKKHQQGDLT